MKSVSIDDPDYPGLLKTISDPPEKLYYKGLWDGFLFNKCLAVVGSRRMTAYGRDVTIDLVSQLASAGITIVSGFMYGIDACSHRSALAVKGRTIAVLPCGVNLIHPAHQVDLYNQILDQGSLILSEFEPNYPPAKWTYPRRNRIVAGLSQATLVVEAAVKSGSLITAELTLKFSRKLFAVPGNITAPTASGTLALIKTAKADLVTCAQDILVFFGLSLPQTNKILKPITALNKFEKDILKALKFQPLSVDELSLKLRLTPAALGAAVSLMQLKGLISEENQKWKVYE